MIGNEALRVNAKTYGSHGKGQRRYQSSLTNLVLEVIFPSRILNFDTYRESSLLTCLHLLILLLLPS
jgi:hypothetical protein